MGEQLDTKSYDELLDEYNARDPTDKRHVRQKDVARMRQLLSELSINDKARIENRREKEDIEESLSCFGNVHFIHKTFDQAKAHLKADSNRYKRDKEKIKELLDQTVKVFHSDKLYVDPVDEIKSEKKLRSLEHLDQLYDMRHAVLCQVIQENGRQPEKIEDENLLKAIEQYSLHQLANFSKRKADLLVLFKAHLENQSIGSDDGENQDVLLKDLTNGQVDAQACTKLLELGAQSKIDYETIYKSMSQQNA